MPRNDVVCQRIARAALGWQAALNTNLQRVREALVNPMPMAYARGLSGVPPASNWPGCLVFCVGLGFSPRDCFLLSDGAVWWPMNGGASVSGTSVESDVLGGVLPLSIDEGAPGAGWPSALDGFFQTMTAAFTRPWPIPSFQRVLLPDPASWAWSIVRVDDARASPAPWERLRISNGSKWLPFGPGDVNVDPVPSTWAALGSRPVQSSISTTLGNVTFSSGWSAAMNTRLAFMGDLWRKPLPLYHTTRASLLAQAASDWRYCFAVVTDPLNVSGGLYSGLEADEALYVSDGSTWRRLRDNSAL